jgi:hypothetical protein
MLYYCTVLDIIHNPVVYLKQVVSETGFCPSLQVKSIQLGPKDRAIRLNRLHLKMGIESSFRS